MDAPFRHPVIVDLDTGIRYMNHAHASTGDNGGNAYTANRYSLVPRPDLPVKVVWQARVVACTLVNVEALSTQHTILKVE